MAFILPAISIRAPTHPAVPLPAVAISGYAAFGSGVSSDVLLNLTGSPAVVKALLAVLPAGTPVMPVGGITPSNMADWRAGGAAGFGIGSALYKPGKQAAAVREDARKFIAAWTGAIQA